MVALYALAGFLSGILSGMGIGGGTVLIPALVFLFGLSQQTAQSMNLLYFIPTAAIALYVHIRNNSVEKSIVARLILFGLLSAAAGSFIAMAISGAVLKKIFGGFLLIMGIMEFKKCSSKAENEYEGVENEMRKEEFDELVGRFISSDVDEKIDIYTTTEGLVSHQYKELLKHFPFEEIGKLERALDSVSC